MLARDLARHGFEVERQKPISFEFERLRFEKAFRADLIVEDVVVVEVKSVSELAAAHKKQLLTYLRLLDCPVGLLMNFGAALMKDGIKRSSMASDGASVPGQESRVRELERPRTGSHEDAIGSKSHRDVS